MGGSPSPPKTYSPAEHAQAQMQIDAANAQRAAEAEQRAAQAAAEERARQEQAKQADIQRTSADKSRLYDQGTAYGSSQLGNLGFADTYGLMDTYRGLLDAARTKVPEQSNDVGQYFNYQDMWSNAMNQETTQERNRLSGEYGNATGVGWQNNYFADTADDAILDAILGEQYGETFDTIDAARARGQMSQGAFDNTLRALDSKKAGARAQLEDLGLGVLGGYRDELGGIATQYGDKITNYSLGQNVSMDDMIAQLTGRKDTLSARMAGDVRNAVGDTMLFDPATLMAKGGAAAGVSNNPLRNAFMNNQALDPERTTGTTGVF